MTSTRPATTPEDSVTISGLAEPVANIVEELKSENIFAREVNSLGIAFHCKHMDSIGPALCSALSQVIREPKRRSKRWISSSVPEKQWSDALGLFCSAEYQTNNFLSPVLFQEALQHVPRDAVLVEIAPHCLLQAILRREVGTDAISMGIMKRNIDNVEHFLASLGKLHTLGFQLDLSPLYPPVPWPVPRGTPNIAHLVSWDHSQRWNVFSWKDFCTSEEMAEDVVEVNLEANEADKYLSGHQPDGRMLFPAAGYLVLVWKSLAKRIGQPFDQVPVIFEDVSFHRATLLPRSGCVRFLVNVMRLTGEFEVGEASTVVATGRVRAAKQGEKLLDQDPPSMAREEVTYDLDAADIYKELKLRGYEYHGAFQGILKAHVIGKKPGISPDKQRMCRKCFYSDQSESSATSVFEAYILPSCSFSFNCNGTSQLRNRTCRFIYCYYLVFCNAVVLRGLHPYAAIPSYDAAFALEFQGSRGQNILAISSLCRHGLDVVYDRHQNTCHAGGVMVKGLESSIAQRRSVEETPHLQEYRFVPYKDDDAAKEQRYDYVLDYVHMCSDISRRILASHSENETVTDELQNSCNILPDYETKVSNEDTGDNRSLLDVLLTASKGKNVTCATSRIRSLLHNQRRFLNRDKLSTALFAEDPLRTFLDIVLENVGSKKVRVIELAAGRNPLLVTAWALPWLSLQDTRFKVECAVAHRCPENITPDQVPDGVNVVTWNTSTGSIEGLNEADLTIVARGGAGTNLSTNALAKQLSSHCKELSFILISQRTALTEAETALSSFDDALFRKYSDDDVVSELRAQGLLLVGLKSNHLSSLLLFRKHSEGAGAMKQDVVKIKNARIWMDRNA
ncbi:hypothetical protein HPB50_022694 [Hyalomma asiaticum]|uniref:Uncharacterized protein n=1 Tax=Hyalomma asiaticum TaxID=266040 RepID=A0ACB7T8M3_HYAAI|nr:hypothetical protein HPB50_022694 [Hyalomma asiaticum]